MSARPAEPVRIVRPIIDVRSAKGGWPYPWPNVAELARVLPGDQWTLIGGLMTQMHAIHSGVDVVRPTNGVDIVLHIETTRGLPNATAAALESLDYELVTSNDDNSNTAHRFTRGTSHVDVVTSDHAEDRVDVVVADHPAPSIEEQLRRREMIKVDGGTQALRRTANYRLAIGSGEVLRILCAPD